LVIDLKMKLLSRLIAAMGISGNEENVRKIIESEIKGYVDEMHVDKLGNLIAHKWGQRPRVMLAAHMDEIGIMIKDIDDDGKMQCSLIGGVNPAVILGQHVHVHTKDGKVIHGVVTTSNLSDGWVRPQKKPIRSEELLIDTGLTKSELEKGGVDKGCLVSPHQHMNFLGSSDIISGKAIDNRVGCFILIQLAKKLKEVQSDVYYVFTVQEEFGLFGSTMSAYKIEPEWALAIDVTSTGEFSHPPYNVLGKGPCLTLKDADTITNKKLNERIRKVAKDNGIPLQLEVSDIGTTDAFSISVTKGGVPASILSVPMRNLETAIGLVHKKDISNTIKLLEHLLRKPILNLV
jgi:putative aminopeptidase FrvX